MVKKTLRPTRASWMRGPKTRLILVSCSVPLYAFICLAVMKLVKVLLQLSRAEVVRDSLKSFAMTRVCCSGAYILHCVGMCKLSVQKN